MEWSHWVPDCRHQSLEQVSHHQTVGTSYRAESPNIGLLAQVIRTESLATEPLAPIARAVSPATKLVTKQPNGRGETTVCFWKMFYQF